MKYKISYFKRKRNEIKFNYISYAPGYKLLSNQKLMKKYFNSRKGKWFFALKLCCKMAHLQDPFGQTTIILLCDLCSI